MKLIIDIPEKVVTAIQNGEDYRYDIHTAIAQGIPYEERPQGEWKLDDTEQFCYCSNCEDTYYPRPLDPDWYYCPHCGAKMKGGAE